MTGQVVGAFVQSVNKNEMWVRDESSTSFGYH